MPNDGTTYRCPGEPYAISRAVHLGRLASYYPKCRDCTHRAEVGTLSTRQVQKLAEVDRRAASSALTSADAIAGVLHTQITAAHMRRWAVAFAAHLAEFDSTASPVVLACDGRGPVAELVAATSEGLRWSGCDVIDIGAVSAPQVTLAMRDSNAAGGLYAGNPASLINTAGVRFWSRDGQRLEIGSGLEQIIAGSNLPPRRAGRRAGNLKHVTIDEQYVSRLAPYFHALRPLRLVVDCRSLPASRLLQHLIADTGCQMIFVPTPAETGVDRLLARHVQKYGAHGGVWIDGDGESLQLVDENGRRASAAQLEAGINALGEAFPRHDALHALALLLTLLSTSDRAVSDVLPDHFADGVLPGVARVEPLREHDGAFEQR